MRIGIPRETKDGEYRVALTPAGVARLANVVVEAGAGAGVGFSDAEYEKAGAAIGDPWACDLLVKVKELQPPEFGRPRHGQTVFGFQHFGPHPEVLDAALASGASFVAYETVGERNGTLPILAPMSAIAGRLAVQAGAWCLQKQNGGSGVLLPGLDGVPPGKVVILGAGNAGANALAVADGCGARVSVFARTQTRLATLRARYPNAVFRTGYDEAAVNDADLVIGAVLVPGKMSPKLITRRTLRGMRPGSALVDVGIDQGGIAETSRPTSHSAPTYIEESVVHYCVPNLPSACARTASLALERAVLPYVRMLVTNEWHDDLRTGLQVQGGHILHAQLAKDTCR